MRNSQRIVVSGAFLVAILISMSVAAALAARGQYVTWYVINGELAAKGQSLHLGDSAQTVTLSNGWSCVVGLKSINEARTTICSKESEAFQFVVQCERSRSRDHTQIGFPKSNKGSGDLIDLIEVGCERK